MKFIIIACIFALVAAAPQGLNSDKDAEVLVDNRDVRIDGYNFNHETSDGIVRSEEGSPLAGSGAVAQRGEIRFPFPDGRIFVLRFTADENGYRPESEWLPANNAAINA